jgi:hypothetical protein
VVGGLYGGWQGGATRNGDRGGSSGTAAGTVAGPARPRPLRRGAPTPAPTRNSPALPQGYAFLELRTAEEASNAMAFDGVKFKDANLKVGPAPAGGLLLGLLLRAACCGALRAAAPPAPGPPHSAQPRP